MQQGRRRLIEWFRELRSPLRRYLSRRVGVSQNDIDDVAQEVFLRLLRYDVGDLVTDPGAYLFKVAANVASEWSMRACNRLPHEPAWLDDLIDGHQPDGDLERQLENRRVAVALSKLPARSRDILRLHFSEGLRHQQIADRMKISARVVKRDLINAYELLRVALGAPSSDAGMWAPDGRGVPERPS
jgi:RNA polymerase sigma factor (sigma-70 family)